jgi:predicted nucleotidyltransferase component of viral defense system
MERPEISSGITAHMDHDLFRQAVNFTSAETKFLPRLVEKDYFCTVLLHYLSEATDNLVFKGGTCLAKIHSNFYRLSEDLDFTISTQPDSSRSERRRLSAGLKKAFENLSKGLKDFHLVSPLTGSNNSTQYIAIVGYTSLVAPMEETIKIEVGLREPLLTAAMTGQARTILLNPLTGKEMLPTLPIRCISRIEAMSEKLRAALSRREAAIRDFYDIDYAVRKMNLGLLEPEMTELVRKKLAVPDNGPVDVSEKRRAALGKQLDTWLKPVLRARDFAEFDLDRAFTVVAAVASAIAATSA